MTYFIASGPENASYRMIIAHGAGAGIGSPFLEAIAALLIERGIAVTRFEFDYMAQARDGGKKRPPPRAEKLTAEYANFIASLSARKPAAQKLIIGGKSLGGRVASMIAEEQFASGGIAGLVCLGYPFHAPTTPEKLRIAHLETITAPALIVQGTRDPFGTQSEVEALRLSPSIAFHWIGDGDHDFGPRGASGFTRSGNLTDAADAVAAFLQRLS
ncbi:MAG: alpha/beta hydrolase [Hyphomicrobium sp.]|nr:alpha/beta hydrolase [Hyphomicrobium sp.]